MIVSTSLQLSGVFNPVSGHPGFGIAVFQDTGKLYYVQSVENGCITAFDQVELEDGCKIDEFSGERRRRIGDEALFSFFWPDKSLCVGSKHELCILLEANIYMFQSRLFLISEIANFIEDDAASRSADAHIKSVKYPVHPASDHILRSGRRYSTPLILPPRFRPSTRFGTPPSANRSVAGRKNYLFTSESVSEGHPDKVSDRISDTIVDAYIAAMPEARLNVETLTTTNRIVIAGEVRGPDSVTFRDLEELTREAVRDIGYEQDGFHWKNNDIAIHLHAQSADIAQGVDAASNNEEAACNQGIMFGYASDETPDLMPAPLYYAHKILEHLAIARKTRCGDAAKLGPDAKSQVTIRYAGGRPVEATQIVLSTQHLDESLDSADVRAIVEPYIRAALPKDWITEATMWHVNPTGKFLIGGPDSDAGLTGRQITVDTYGGAAPHGGGAFSGKDPTKVDRSAAYAARYLAKNIVAAGLASKATVQLSYAVGVSKPLSIFVDLHASGMVDESKLEAVLMEALDLSPRGIRTALGLNKPIYARTSAYGHFGRKPDADGGFSWEKEDLAHHLLSLMR